MRTLDDLHGYQREAASFAMANPRCALYMGLGLGKTITALSVIALDRFLGDRGRTLVIAPLRVANTVWRQEAARWEHTAALKVVVATGSPHQRRTALMRQADLYVINVDNVAWLVKHFPKSRWHWDSVVLDESSLFKNTNTSRFKALRTAAVDKLIKHHDGTRTLKRSTVKRMMLLSATPATNGLQNLWSQLFLIDRGKRLGHAFDEFEKTYFTFERPRRNSKYLKAVPKEGAKEAIYKAVADRVFVLDARDHLEMPELITNTITVTMPDSAREGYRELQREFLLELETDKGVEEILAPNAGALCNKLLQYANGAVYTGETPLKRTKDRDYAVVHLAKINALKELVEAAEGNENLLVAYYYQSDLERLQHHFPQAQLLDKAGSQIDAWNRGEIPLLLAQPLSAGMGLNLQHGGATCIFYSLLWQLEAYQQFIGRLYRQGQKRTVTVNHLVCERTIEARVLAALQSNAATQDDFLQALKRTAHSTENLLCAA